MNSLRWLALAVVVFVMTTACQRNDVAQQVDAGPDAAMSGAAVEEAAASAESPSAADPGSGPESDSPSTDESPARSPLGDADLSLPPAKGIDELAAAATSEPVPTTITVDRLGLTGTTVLAVGVEGNGEMTVPPPLDVGWYRFGPRPGEAGSAVLAGHIASGGIPGAFRHLDRLEPGDTITVGFDDGSSQTWVVDELFQVDKIDLPFDTLFARSGPPKLALITCGGEFDYDARSYEDNIVVTASPVTG